MANVQLGLALSSITEPVATPGVATGAFIRESLPVAAAGVASPAVLLLIARQVGEGLKAKSAGLDYHIDIVGGMPRIRIIDKQTMQIIRQIPSDEVLTIHRSLSRSDGILFHQEI